MPENERLLNNEKFIRKETLGELHKAAGNALVFIYLKGEEIPDPDPGIKAVYYADPSGNCYICLVEESKLANETD